MITESPGRATEHLRETQTSRRVIYHGRLLTFYEDDVRLADGTRAQREVVAHPGAVAIVAIDDADRVVLVRQWRHAVDRALWELPAGTRDRDEAPARTAERELAEETGLRAARIRPLATAPLTPGYSTEVMHFFLATDLTEGPTDRDADERMDVERFDSRPDRGAGPATARWTSRRSAGLGLAGWSTERRWLTDRFATPRRGPPDRARHRIRPRRRARDFRAVTLLAVEASPKSQPWAETAAPPASDKRPLEAVLAEYEARVAAAPGARAGHPNEPHPGEAYLEKLSPAPREHRQATEATLAGRTQASRWPGRCGVGRWRARVTGAGEGTAAPNRRRPLRLRRDARRILASARGAR